MRLESHIKKCVIDMAMKGGAEEDDARYYADAALVEYKSSCGRILEIADKYAAKAVKAAGRVRPELLYSAGKGKITKNVYGDTWQYIRDNPLQNKMTIMKAVGLKKDSVTEIIRNLIDDEKIVPVQEGPIVVYRISEDD